MASDAGFQFGSRVFCEGEGNDRVLRRPVVDEAGDPARDRLRLPATGAGDDEKVAARMVDGVLLSLSGRDQVAAL